MSTVPAVPDSGTTSKDEVSGLLAPLRVADRLPWYLVDGEPTWLVMTEVLGSGLHEVEYPDGSRSTLRDSE